MQTGRILIADDNPLVRACLANLLEKWGLRFTLCENGLQAWNFLQKNKYDMLLVDLQMPKMDGHELVGKLRTSTNSLNRSIPIIAIAGSNDPRLVRQIKKAGADSLILKPFEPGALFKIVSSIAKIPNHKKVRFFSDDIDRATLDSLYGGDQDHLKIMIKLFLKNTPKDLRQMKMAMQKGDLDTVEKVVHKLKPTFKMVGLGEVSKQANVFEEKLNKAKETVALNKEYRKFSNSVEKAIKVISIEQKNLLKAK